MRFLRKGKQIGCSYTFGAFASMSTTVKSPNTVGDKEEIIIESRLALAQLNMLDEKAINGDQISSPVSFFLCKADIEAEEQQGASNEAAIVTEEHDSETHIGRDQLNDDQIQRPLNAIGLLIEKLRWRKQEQRQSLPKKPLCTSKLSTMDNEQIKRQINLNFNEP
jgi:hypothetical protein